MGTRHRGRSDAEARAGSWRDTRLDRSVAIKVLPPAFASDAQFRERFERETSLTPGALPTLTAFVVATPSTSRPSKRSSPHPSRISP